MLVYIHRSSFVYFAGALLLIRSAVQIVCLSWPGLLACGSVLNYDAVQTGFLVGTIGLREYFVFVD